MASELNLYVQLGHISELELTCRRCGYVVHLGIDQPLPERCPRVDCHERWREEGKEPSDAIVRLQDGLASARRTGEDRRFGVRLLILGKWNNWDR